jgi:hypothetical protein
MSSLADKSATLADRLRTIDECLAILRREFADASLPAAVGDQDASKALAATEAEIDRLVRERAQLVAAAQDGQDG